MIFEWDDLGASHVISDQCRSHDCRDQLLKLRNVNPAFKATLFAIPGEMTIELLNWTVNNSDWIQLAWHGFFHGSNYECEKMTYDEFDIQMRYFWSYNFDKFFVDVFRAPGWQISNDVLRWLHDHEWIICDQNYNDERRPAYMNAYVNYDGHFKVLPKIGNPKDIEAYHGHVWDVGWNGIYEDFDKVQGLVAEAKEFKFIKELFA